MDNKNEKKLDKRIVSDNRLGLFIGGCAKPRITSIRQFVECEKSKAMILLNAVISRGNYGRIVNVAGEYHVTELELEK
jgi:hypothetical protein